MLDDITLPVARRVQLRRYPYPYQGALAFISDIDGTSFPSFARTHGCFYGMEPDYEGVSLEMTSSYWLMAAEQPDLRNSIYALELNGRERPFVRDRISPFLRSKLFDSIHTYGDFNQQHFAREHAEMCIDYAQRRELRPQLWTYHGSPHECHNIRVDSDTWRGDDPESDVYHLDALKELGIRYFRMPPSRDLTNMAAERRVEVARDGTRLLTHEAHATIRAPHNHAEVVAWIDGLDAAGQLQVPRRRMFQGNDRFPEKLLTWHPELLSFQITEAILDGAIASGRTLYVNQHLTRDKSNFAYATERNQTALRLLSRYQEEGRMLVTGPARLITFETVRDHVVIDRARKGDTNVFSIRSEIDIDGYRLKLTRSDIEGIAIQADNLDPAVILFDGREVEADRVMDADRTTLYSIPWTSRLGEQRAALEEFKQTFGEEDG